MLLQAGDFIKIEDIGPLAQVLKTGNGQAYLKLDGKEFWCPLSILSMIEEAV